MPSYIVSVKKGLSEDQFKEAQKHAADQGGKVTDTFDRNGVMPGFVVEVPADNVGTLSKGPHVEAVESNGVMKTQ